MHGKYTKSIVIDKYERKIGIIGVILSTTNVSATRFFFKLNSVRGLLFTRLKRLNFELFCVCTSLQLSILL